MRILHLLQMNMNEISKIIPDIKSQGFDAVQISPVQPLKEDRDGEWYMLFQPIGFRIGNYYGSKEDLVNLCKIANENDIRIIVDVVCNHMANLDQNHELTPHPNVDNCLKENPDFWKEQKPIQNWENRDEVIHYCMNLPGLNLANKQLQEIILNFLIELAECGVGGFRFDAAKQIALPNEVIIANFPEKNQEIFDSILNEEEKKVIQDILKQHHLNFKNNTLYYNGDQNQKYQNCHFWDHVIQDGLSNYDLYNYGELIFVSNDLREAYSKYIGVLSNWYVKELDNSITYVESHDSYLSTDELGWTRTQSEDEICERYNRLTMEWPNTVFFNRPNTEMWKREDILNANYQNKQVKTKKKTM